MHGVTYQNLSLYILSSINILSLSFPGQDFSVKLPHCKSCERLELWLLAKDLARENFVEFQILHSFRVWIRGEANSDGNGKILLQIQGDFCLWYHQSNERKGCGCSSMQVWMLDIPQEKQRSLSSLQLSQKLSNLHRELYSPQLGRIPLCPIALEVWKSSQEETCLLCSLAWCTAGSSLGTIADSFSCSRKGRALCCLSSREVNMKFSEWGKWMEIIWKETLALHYWWYVFFSVWCPTGKCAVTPCVWWASVCWDHQPGSSTVTGMWGSILDESPEVIHL